LIDLMKTTAGSVVMSGFFGDMRAGLHQARKQSRRPRASK
jgi:hypothetical protein